MARARRRGWLSRLLDRGADEAHSDYELVVLEGADRGASYPVRELVTQIGRADPGTPQSGGILLSDRSVSSKQALLSCEDGRLFLQHLPSATNPTLVNGRKISRKRLRGGDRVTLGLVVLELRVVPPPEALRETGPPEATSDPRRRDDTPVSPDAETRYTPVPPRQPPRSEPPDVFDEQTSVVNEQAQEDLAPTRIERVPPAREEPQEAGDRPDLADTRIEPLAEPGGGDFSDGEATRIAPAPPIDYSEGDETRAAPAPTGADYEDGARTHVAPSPVSGSTGNADETRAAPVAPGAGDADRTGVRPSPKGGDADRTAIRPTPAGHTPPDRSRDGAETRVVNLDETLADEEPTQVRPRSPDREKTVIQPVREERDGERTVIQPVREERDGEKTVIRPAPRERDGERTVIQPAREERDGEKTVIRPAPRGRDGERTVIQPVREERDGEKTVIRPAPRERDGERTVIQPVREERDGEKTVIRPVREERDGEKTVIRPAPDSSRSERPSPAAETVIIERDPDDEDEPGRE